MKRIVRTIVLSLFVCSLLAVQTKPTGATTDHQQGQPPPISPIVRQELIFKDSGVIQPGVPEAEATEIVPWSKLVFQSYRDNDWEIYRANGDGTGQVRLTNNGDLDKDARLNRGATRVVFASTRSGGDADLYLMNPDGSGVATLFQNADLWEQYTVWSPDNNKIAFESYDYANSKADIYVVNANGSGLQRLTNSGSYDGMPFWSPDGAKIAFALSRSGQYRIWVMNADGTGARMLSNQPGSFDPTWSPDGSQIAYDADVDGDGHEEVWLMNADGSNQRMASIHRRPTTRPGPIAGQPMAATSPSLVSRSTRRIGLRPISMRWTRLCPTA